MSSHLSADHPAAQPPGPGSVEALISQARRLRGDVDAVRQDSQDDETDPRGRWRRALYDLALHQLTDLDAHLAQLRDGPAQCPRRFLLSRVGSAEWNDLLVTEPRPSGPGTLPASWAATPARPSPLSLDEDSSPWSSARTAREADHLMVADCLVDARPIDGEFRNGARPDGDHTHRAHDGRARPRRRRQHRVDVGGAAGREANCAAVSVQ